MGKSFLAFLVGKSFCLPLEVHLSLLPNKAYITLLNDYIESFMWKCIMHVYLLIDNWPYVFDCGTRLALFLLTNLHPLKSLNKVTCVKGWSLQVSLIIIFFLVSYAPRDMPVPVTAFL